MTFQMASGSGLSRITSLQFLFGLMLVLDSGTNASAFELSGSSSQQESTTNSCGIPSGDAAQSPATRTAASPEVLPDGMVGARYFGRLPGSSEPGVYRVVGLPSGLICNSTTGEITGIPAQPGRYVLRVTATDPQGSARVVTCKLSVTSFFPELRGRYFGVMPPDGMFGVMGFVHIKLGTLGYYTGYVEMGNLDGKVFRFPFIGRIRETDPDGDLHEGNEIKGRYFKGRSTPMPKTTATPVPTVVELYVIDEPGADTGLRIAARLAGASAQAASTWGPASIPLSKEAWSDPGRPANAYTGRYTATSPEHGYATLDVTRSGDVLAVYHRIYGPNVVLHGALGGDGGALFFQWAAGNKRSYVYRANITLGTKADGSDTSFIALATETAKGPPEDGGFLNWEEGYFGARYVTPSGLGGMPDLLLGEKAFADNLQLTVSGGVLDYDYEAKWSDFSGRGAYLRGTLDSQGQTKWPIKGAEDEVVVERVTFDSKRGTFRGTIARAEKSPGLVAGIKWHSYPMEGVISRSDPTSPVWDGTGIVTARLLAHPSIDEPSPLLLWNIKGIVQVSCARLAVPR